MPNGMPRYVVWHVHVPHCHGVAAQATTLTAHRLNVDALGPGTYVCKKCQKKVSVKKQLTIPVALVVAVAKDQLVPWAMVDCMPA